MRRRQAPLSLASRAMAPSRFQPPDLLATLLVLDDLQPLRHALRRVFTQLDDPAVDALERQVRLCGSAPVYSGSVEQARAHASGLKALGLTTSLNLAAGPAAAAALAQGVAPVV